jgi:AraC family transcriptional regulator of adaptative response/methylated-DNA-[protein]-cysteine methyltransferase
MGSTSDQRWRAVLARDHDADGAFFYAVVSTGIFCKPSCPSRRPRRDRVRFFASATHAAAEGFRPCLRCRPLDQVDVWTRRVARACQTIASADAPPSLAALARQAGSSPHHFLRRFKDALGVTPREYAAARRLDVVKRRLRTDADVTSAVFEAGYGSLSRFYEGAAPRLAMSPAAYRAGGEGQTIRFAIVSSSIGRVLVAATDRGVCAVLPGDSERALKESLRSEFPRAALIAASADIGPWVEAVVQQVDGVEGTRLSGIPLDVRATAFQWRVWTALMRIPRGETRTYSEVAAAIGQPRAARAVARACAANRVAVAIPCHRVVPAGRDTGPGGYRWGTDRKKALLARERIESGINAPGVRPIAVD